MCIVMIVDSVGFFSSDFDPIHMSFKQYIIWLYIKDKSQSYMDEAPFSIVCYDTIMYGLSNIIVREPFIKCCLK